MGLLALPIVGHAVVISGLLGFAFCRFGFDGVVHYGDVGPSSSSSILLMWVSPSDPIPWLLPHSCRGTDGSRHGGVFFQFDLVLIHYLQYASFVSVFVLKSLGRYRCVLLLRNVVPILPSCFCVTTWWMVILSSSTS